MKTLKLREVILPVSYSQLVAKKAGVVSSPDRLSGLFPLSLLLTSVRQHVVASSYPGHSTLCNCNDEIMTESFSFWSSQMTVGISECWYYNFSVQSTEFIVYWLFPVSVEKTKNKTDFRSAVPALKAGGEGTYTQEQNKRIHTHWVLWMHRVRPREMSKLRQVRRRMVRFSRLRDQQTYRRRFSKLQLFMARE